MSLDLAAATERALAAAGEGQLADLAAALDEREAAIRESALDAASIPGGSLDERVLTEQAAAFRDGQTIHSLLTALRRRIDDEHRHLARLSSALANPDSAREPAIDFFG